jgi:hypothetical protein
MERTKYDEKGRVVEEGEYGLFGKVKSRCLYKYDKKGNKSHQLFEDNESSPHSTFSKFDSQGNEIARIMFVESSPLTAFTQITFCKYNDEGVKIGEEAITFYKSLGTVQKAFYECDADGIPSMVPSQNVSGSLSEFEKRYEWAKKNLLVF